MLVVFLCVGQCVSVWFGVFVGGDVLIRLLCVVDVVLLFHLSFVCYCPLCVVFMLSWLVCVRVCCSVVLGFVLLFC